MRPWPVSVTEVRVVAEAGKVTRQAFLKERLHVLLQAALVALQGQHVVALLPANLLGDGRLRARRSCLKGASIVTVAPRMSKRSSSLGMAVISFDFSSQATLPSVSPFSLDQEITRASHG